MQKDLTSMKVCQCYFSLHVFYNQGSLSLDTASFYLSYGSDLIGGSSLTITNLNTLAAEVNHFACIFSISLIAAILDV